MSSILYRAHFKFNVSSTNLAIEISALSVIAGGGGQKVIKNSGLQFVEFTLNNSAAIKAGNITENIPLQAKSNIIGKAALQNLIVVRTVT